jgi:hypothetical protein
VVFLLPLSVSLLGGCVASSNSVPTTTTALPAYTGKVVVSATSVPEGAQEVGKLEVKVFRWRYLLELVHALQSDAAAMGADFAKIDDIRMDFRSESDPSLLRSMPSGPPGAKPSNPADPSNKPGAATSGDHHMDVERTVVVTTLIGRAFKTVSQ